MYLYILLMAAILSFFIYKYTTAQTKIHQFEGEIAKTPEQIERGLMFRKEKLGDNEGMLFLMKPDNHSFWMKNTYIPLDVLFLDRDMRVVGFVENTTPLSLKSISIVEQSQNILEVDSGTVDKYHIKKRDKIVFTEKNP